MALTIQSCLCPKKPHLLFCTHPSHPPTTKRRFTISSQDSSQLSKPTTNDDPTTEPKKPVSSGQGFGSAQVAKSAPSPPISKKQKKGGGKRERATVIRRSPLEKPRFPDKEGEQQAKEKAQIESAFLLAWLGLGALILVEGIALAASGFLPEDWDKLFVKYLYPSFTPTVFTFVAGTVTYGVFKYLQNENLNRQK
ncbi:hypothetical protein Dimus_028311 [Dionaea muscipula]